jgi:hypothetical protein
VQKNRNSFELDFTNSGDEHHVYCKHCGHDVAEDPMPEKAAGIPGLGRLFSSKHASMAKLPNPR